MFGYTKCFVCCNSINCVITERPDMVETSVLGAALAAGKGVGLWREIDSVNTSSVSTFTPSDISHDGE